MAALSLSEQYKAIGLYLSGLSMREVALRCHVSIDAVVYTLRRHKKPRRTSQESNRLLYEMRPLSYSLKNPLTIQDEFLVQAAVMLYWAEGYKRSAHGIDFANSDPEMALLFICFLRRICNVTGSRIRCSLYCYEGQDIEIIKQFWSAYLSVPESQFTKTYVKQSAPSKRGPRMIHGLVHIRYCDKKLLQQVLIWIEEYSRKCVGGRVVNYTTL